MNLDLDTDTQRMVLELGEVRASIANHRLRTISSSYPELDACGVIAKPCSALVTIREAVRRELQRNRQVLRDLEAVK